MKHWHFILPLLLLLLFIGLQPLLAAEENLSATTNLTSEDQEIIEIMELLELLELLNDIEDVAALEDDQ